MDEAEWDRWAQLVFAHARIEPTEEGDEDIAALKIRLSVIERHIEEYFGLARSKDLAPGVFARVMKEQEDEKSLVTAQLEAALSKAITIPDIRLNAWKTLSIDERREFIQAITQSIVVDKAEVTVTLRTGVQIIMSDKSVVRFPLLQRRSKGHWKFALVPPITPYQQYENRNGTIHWVGAHDIRLANSVPRDSKQCPACGKVLKRIDYGHSSYCKPCISLWRSSHRKS
jgi:hypothetical protein